ncbi:glycoside hydrolase family 16 protein [Actinocorallia longicatena]|uniref:Glycoside hydrolase family 16 protein n=1 Tax=Actinocorallia longicatena TaxID=111803 RepID=A0ABP6QKX5_9ACTN
MTSVRTRVAVTAALATGALFATAGLQGVVAEGRSAERTVVPASATVKKTAVKKAAAKKKKAAPKWRLVWSDEFRGRKGVRPSTAKWFSQTGDRGGWGVGGLAYYDPAQAVQNGHGRLLITAKKNKTARKCWYGTCKYTSARLQTSGRFTQKYGRFAARIKFPTGKGIFPAFWLQNPNAKGGTKKYSEIDIAEVYGAHTNSILGAAHQKKKVKDTKKVFKKPLHARYHTYGVDWTPTEVTWWVDGKAYGRMKRYKGWSFNQPMQIIMNLQIGGNWQGPPNAATRFPAVMAVDYVRVYERASKK